jgi:hypothetical protein
LELPFDTMARAAHFAKGVEIPAPPNGAVQIPRTELTVSRGYATESPAEQRSFFHSVCKLRIKALFKANLSLIRGWSARLACAKCRR